MANVSIRERILRQIVRDVEGIPGVGTVHRWRAEHDSSYQQRDVIVAPQLEEIVDGAIGNPGTVICTLPVTVAVVLFPDASDTDSTDEIRGRWQKLVYNALSANRTIVESASPNERLARDSLCAQAGEASLVDGAVNAAVVLTVEYEHPSSNPYQHGTLISLLTE